MFDGTNYKRWRAKMIMLLMAMNIYHVPQEKPEQFNPKEDKAFKAVDNLF